MIILHGAHLGQAPEETLKTMVMILSQTASPEAAKRKAGTTLPLCGGTNPVGSAEDYLRQIEKQPGYSILLLRLLSIQSVEVMVQQIASITFKNFVKAYWQVTDSDC